MNSDHQSDDDPFDIGIGTFLFGLRLAYRGLKHLVTHKAVERRKRFGDVYVPLFETFRGIHRDYLGMLNQLDNSLTRIAIGQIPLTALDEVRQGLSERREEYLEERTRLRAESRELLQSATHTEEQRFVYSLLCYFLDIGDPFMEAANMDTAIRILLTEGHGALMNSPTSAILEQLNTLTDAPAMQKIVRSKRADLAAYFTTASNMFVDVKRAVKL